MNVRVGLPVLNVLRMEGDTVLEGGIKARRIEVRSLSSGLKEMYAVFRPSPLGKPFGRFHEERWEMVGLYPDVGEAYRVAREVGGTYRVWVEGWGGRIEVVADGMRWVMDSPLHVKGRVWVEDMWVGKGFHWQRRERALYEGKITVYGWGKGVRAVVELPMEIYVGAVASSEMHPDAPFEALKAQVVAARTNLVRTAGKHHPNEPYDVCAEDHCQVFRGLHVLKDRVLKAAEETAGEIITYDGEPIEARYSKSCGGITETFSVVWGEEDRPYSPSFRDWERDEGYDASTDEGFLKFYPVEDSFCNVDFPGIENLYRWEVSYSREELTEKLKHLGVGKVLHIVPLKRGRSGRIYELSVIGLECERKIRGEYAIRETLGNPFLPSSAFVVEKVGDGFVLKGMGWGHGVGMCQIGAIGMAMRGYDYRDILKHYYRGTNLTRM